MIEAKLIEAILRQYRLPLKGIHGPTHWARVLENGRRLAELTGADTGVVELFAVFHDACRHNEGHDSEHGSRGAILAAALRGGLYDLADFQFRNLTVACRFHTKGHTDGDVTVQTCWDADRLDLGRVGIKPHPPYLCTEAAKTAGMIDWAHHRAMIGFTPGFVDADWLGERAFV